MSFSNIAESNLWKLIFQNIAWANIGDATGLPGSAAPGSLYVALHTADPGEAGDQTTSEVAYTGYARVAVSRNGAAGFTLSGTAPTQVANTAETAFPPCTAGSPDATHFSIGRASAGAGEIIVKAALSAALEINPGITPKFAAAALVATID